MEAYKPTKADYFFNMLGCISSAVASLVLVLGITRIAGPDAGGTFSIAFAIAQLLMIVGNMGLRTYQVSDIEGRYSMSEYVVNRIVSCACMMALAAAYCLFSCQSAKKGAVILLVTAAKMADALGDVFEGQLQKDHCLRIAGISVTIRMTVSTALCLGMLVMTGNLVTACFSMCISAGVCTAVFSIVPVLLIRRRGEDTAYARFSILSIVSLFVPAFPLFFSMFGLQMIASMPKYAIDLQMTEAMQAVYSILYLPAQVVSLLSNFVFKPLVGEMAFEWHEQMYAAFRRRIYKLLLLICACAVCTLVAGMALGIPVLELLSGLELKAYKTELMLMIAGGAFTASSALLLQVITIIRKQNNGFLVYLVMALFSALLDFKMVKRMGLMGAAVGYMIQVLLLASLLFVVYRVSIRKKLQIAEVL